MTHLDPLLDRLATFEPTTLPVIGSTSTRRQTRHGRDNFESFLQKELKAGGKTCPVL